MPAAPDPANESERVAALHALDVLDSPPESAFDRITAMAARIFGAPISLVSLVDEDRQWFKSRVGIDACETPRGQAFCAHAIHSPQEVLVVENAEQDPRFADNPLVTGDPGIRFYAGAPLVTSEGHALGTLCVIGQEPRVPTEDELATLRDLSRIVVDELMLRIANEQLRSTGDQLARSNEDLEGFAYAVSHDLQAPLRHVTSFSRILAEGLGDSLAADDRRALKHVVSGAERMKQLIGDLLSYSRVCQGVDRAKPVSSAKCLEDALLLLEHPISEMGARIEVAELPELVFEAPKLTQLFQNLVSNALKYRSDATPEVTISAQRIEGAWELAVADNGIGVPEKHRERIFGILTRLHDRDEVEGTGIGLALCKRIVEQRGGRIRVEDGPSGGSRFVFSVPDC